MKNLSKNGLVANIVMLSTTIVIVLIMTLVKRGWTNLSLIVIGIYLIFLALEIFILSAYIKNIKKLEANNKKFQEELKKNKSPDAEIRMLDQSQYESLMKNRVLEFPGKSSIILGEKNDNK
jgi:small-conductance mechanosensitive channel